MKISLQDVEKWFDFLINEEKPREDVANWAQNLMFANDEGVLEYDPSTDKKKTWNGIKYLVGVDLKNADGSYLHTKEDFIQYRKEKNI